MVILIDPPLWPAHGTMFSHVVSDKSLEELHDFVLSEGISPRAFDRDHYDVPAHRRDDLIAAGAQPVGAGELTRRLRASGLRVPARERPEKLRRPLLARWAREMPRHPRLGESLLDRWQGEGRYYHDPVHLFEVIDHLDQLEQNAAVSLSHEDRTVLFLAAWYHDVVYRGVPGQDERDSAEALVQDLGSELPTSLIGRVRGIILATVSHAQDVEADSCWPLFHDADLGILGKEAARYGRYVAAVRAEYAHCPDPVFAAGRSAILKKLMSGPRLYMTDEGYRLWERQARHNLVAEIRVLERRASTGEGSGPSVS